MPLFLQNSTNSLHLNSPPPSVLKIFTLQSYYLSIKLQKLLKLHKASFSFNKYSHIFLVNLSTRIRNYLLPFSQAIMLRCVWGCHLMFNAFVFTELNKLFAFKLSSSIGSQDLHSPILLSFHQATKVAKIA